jgi:DNA-binding transcriptional regulator YiaG
MDIDEENMPRGLEQSDFIEDADIVEARKNQLLQKLLDETKTIVRLEQTIRELRQQLTKPADAELIEAAKAVVERWETPLWKDAPATAGYIYRLRDAINAYKPTEG